MKIWVITHLYPYSEKPRYGFFIHKSLRSLATKGHQVSVFFLVPWLPLFFRRQFLNQAQAPTLPYNLEGVEVFPLLYFPRLSKLSPWLDIYLKQYLVQQRATIMQREHGLPDVVYAQMLYLDGCIATKIAASLSVPLVVMMRGDDVHTHPIKSSKIKNLIRAVFAKSDLVLSVSEALAREGQQRWPQDLGSFEVLYTICDTDRFRALVSIQTPPRRLLFVGALVPEKGVYELLDAMRSLVQDFPNCKLVFVGEGPARGELEARIAAYRLQAHVELEGFVEHSNMPLKFNESDVLVFPSHKEGLPNSVVEAVACERCVVVSDVGGVKEIAPDSPSFVRIPPQNSQAIVKAVRQVFTTPIEELQHHLAQARRFVSHRFGLVSHVNKIEALLQQTLDLKRSR